MRHTVWVGKVKSNVPSELLESTFGRIGPVLKVETGFAGFAFVEFETEADADRACQELDRKKVENLGMILVSRATSRGYEDAVMKRDKYQQAWRGGPKKQNNWSPSKRGRRQRPTSTSRERQPNREGSVSRSRSRSYGSNSSGGNSCSRGRRRRSPTAHRGRQASASRSRRSESRKSRSLRSERDRARPQKVPMAPWRQHSTPNIPPPAPPPPPNMSTNKVVPYTDPDVDSAGIEQEVSPPQLNDADRAAVISFFDGAAASELLLEGAAVLRVPDFMVPAMLNGYPHSFQDMSQSSAMQMLEVLRGFSASEGVRNDTGGQLTTEVRQTLIVSANGRRLMRKSISINGEIAATLEREL